MEVKVVRGVRVVSASGTADLLSRQRILQGLGGTAWYAGSSPRYGCYRGGTGRRLTSSRLSTEEDTDVSEAAITGRTVLQSNQLG